MNTVVVAADLAQNPEDEFIRALDEPSIGDGPLNFRIEPTLAEQQRAELLELLNEFAHVFTASFRAFDFSGTQNRFK